MHQRRLHLVLAVAVATLVLTSCSSSSLPFSPGLSTQCAAKPNGALCLKIIDVGKVVGDVIGYVGDSGTSLSGKTWRIALSRFGCDPGTGARPACTPSVTYPSKSRHGLIPRTTYCKDQNGATITAPPGCHDSLLELLGSDGDFAGFSLRPNGLTFPAGTWLCISEQVLVAGRWQPVTTTSPLRACHQVG